MAKEKLCFLGLGVMGYPMAGHLQKAGYEIGTGGFASDACSKAAKALIAAGFASVDYVECRDAVTLETVEKMGDRPIRIFGAAHIGRARLIDNHPIN
ncbi:MAG: hypothetical protein COB84_04355 [Rhodobacteraceae bacterium]|nr:MAG: hypothetical protein COB84_04355 [Paracoccaceae bacterium]